MSCSSPCGCDACSEGVSGPRQADYNLRWGILEARTKPGASDFWATARAIDAYERGPLPSTSRDVEARNRVDAYVRLQRIGLSAAAPMLDSRYTDAVRTTGASATIVAAGYTNAAGMFANVLGGGLCCPLSIIWTLAKASDMSDHLGYPPGIVNAHGGDRIRF